MEVGLRVVTPDLPLSGLRARRRKSGNTVALGGPRVAWNTKRLYPVFSKRPIVLQRAGKDLDINIRHL